MYVLLSHEPFSINLCIGYEEKVKDHDYTNEYPHIPAPFIKEIFLHPTELHLLQINWPYMCRSILGLYFFPSGSISIPTPRPHCLNG